MSASPPPSSYRARVRQWLHSVAPRKQDMRADALAGLPGAIASVPDGMAASVLAGVNPVYGLYASAVAPIGGGFTQSTRLMVITTTSAAALAAGSTLSKVSAADRPGSLFLLAIIAGIAMIVAGIFKLGRYVRFVTQSVMVGFLSGVAANIIFGQLGDLTGVDAPGSVALQRAWYVVTHPGEIHGASLLCGLSALALIAVLSRTKIASIGALIALVIPTIAVSVFDISGVATVADGGAIPSGVPLPHVPELRLLSANLVVGALAIAAIVLVQGAGVAESAPNPDRSPSDPNRDFAAQGVANIVSGLFRGIAVGGSVGQTAINVSNGARSRWSTIFSGAWMFVILAAFSGVVGNVVMPTLAAVLIFAAIGAIRFGEASAIWRTGMTSRIAMTSTFIATLMLPIPAAVGFGVAIALLLQLNQEALDLKIIELIPRADGKLEEHEAPRRLRDRDIVVLDVYGSLFYAGARTLQAHLPDPSGVDRPVVVLRLRGRTTLGATFFVILADYAERLAAEGGRLYLSGIDPKLIAQLHGTGRISVSGPVEIEPATQIVGESTAAAYRAGQAWLIGHEREESD